MNAYGKRTEPPSSADRLKQAQDRIGDAIELLIHAELEGATDKLDLALRLAALGQGLAEQAGWTIGCSIACGALTEQEAGPRGGAIVQTLIRAAHERLPDVHRPATSYDWDQFMRATVAGWKAPKSD